MCQSKYRFEEYHYGGISTLQEFYGNTLSIETKKSNKALWKKILGILEELKSKQFYSEKDKIRLNSWRKRYYELKKLK
jgi:hypothetical protein